MATITPATPTIAGATVTRVASTPAGDEVTYLGSGDLLIHVENGHASSITVTVAPTTSTVTVPGVGSVTVPDRAIAVAAGAEAAFIFKANEIGAYLNANGRVPLAYTGGNAALTVMALNV